MYWQIGQTNVNFSPESISLWRNEGGGRVDIPRGELSEFLEELTRLAGTGFGSGRLPQEPVSDRTR